MRVTHQGWTRLGRTENAYREFQNTELGLELYYYHKGEIRRMEHHAGKDGTWIKRWCLLVRRPPGRQDDCYQYADSLRELVVWYCTLRLDGTVIT